MLVFQKNTDHVLQDGCKRAHIEPAWLVETVTEINAFLPDDWRLTRTRNNFRIQIVGKHSGALVGSCFRTQGDAVLHIIDSLHLKHFFDCVDLADRETPIKGRVDKKAVPEVLTPNLYYFRPRPEGFSSPLFARQYERIKQKSDGSLTGDQYHRIHPLTRAGLDLEHLMWVRWSINGDVTIVETPDPGYHGKDYWQIPALSETATRGEPADYLSLYDSIVKTYGVRIAPAEDTGNPQYEEEHKFTVEGGESEAAEAFHLVTETVLPEAGWIIRDQDHRRAPQVDVYFDDPQLSLHRAGAAFRMRKKDATRVTLKKRFPETGKEKSGHYRRIEEEAVITSREEKNLLSGMPINAFPYRLIPYIAPSCGLIRPVVVLENHRRILHVRDAQYGQAEICFDRVTYQIEGRMQGPFFEIESKGAGDRAVSRLARRIGLLPHLKPVTISKYERGIRLMHPTATQSP